MRDDDLMRGVDRDLAVVALILTRRGPEPIIGEHRVRFNLHLARAGPAPLPQKCGLLDVSFGRQAESKPRRRIDRMPSLRIMDFDPITGRYAAGEDSEVDTEDKCRSPNTALDPC